MRVLLTRPRDDSVHTASLLAAQGIESLIDPLFALVETPLVFPHLDSHTALAFTSRHAVRIFVAANPAPALPVFCVGDQTAAQAAQTGFTDVRSAHGNAADLARLIQHSLPMPARLLRLRGEMTDDPLADTLTVAGFTVECATLYAMRETPGFAPATFEALRDGALDGVCLYSPRAAARLAALLQTAGLAEACRTLRAWCISEQTAAALASLPFAAVHVAALPTENHLLALLKPLE